MAVFFDFSNIANSKEAIKSTWDDFGNSLKKKEFSYTDIDKAKSTTFLKVFNDLFCAHHGIDNLIAVKALATAIPLDHNYRQTFHNFISGESALAGQTFTAAANAQAVVRVPGVHHLGFLIAAKGTFHIDRSFPRYRYRFCYYSNTFVRLQVFSCVFFLYGVN